ncbi:MAG: hypothetical protein V1755_15155, partial [Chloroflexota bacterium]
GSAVDQGYYPYGPGMMSRGGGWAGPGGLGIQRGNYGMGPGMMGNQRGNYGMGPGMMGAWRGGDGVGPGMMGRYGWGGAQSVNAAPLTVDDARQAANAYVSTLGIDGLEPGEVMIFDNHAYVVIEETATGLGAFELLVDPVSKAAYPEHGPNMMWNLKYGAINHRGMMGGRGGMMGFWSPESATPADITADMPVTQDEAQKAAQAYLDQYQAGAAASGAPVQFYGYYTFDFELDGQVAGMLSVNGNNEQVFLHTWHGKFIEEAE